VTEQAPPDPSAPPPREFALAWRPAPHYRRLVTVALLPLVATLALGRPGYLVLCAPVVAALALAARRPRYGARVNVTPASDRCLEGDEITITVQAEASGPAGSVGVRLTLPPALETATGPAARVAGGGCVEAQWQIRACRWGRWDAGQVVVTVRSPGGLFTGTAAAKIGEITVFPQPPPLTQLALPAELHTRIGDHVDRHPGEGIEFAGVRPFAAGDRLRRINWPVTSRRGTLHVNQLAAERTAEIVTVIDAITDTGPAGESTLDRSVRGATGVARAYTRAGDRVGVLTLYGPLRWIAPGSGQRQYLRIAESVLDIRQLYSFVSPDLARIPRAVLPPGALVIMFSPLLDARAIDAVTDLRERGYAVIVTDVLGSGPVPPSGSSEASLALRVWKLERRALRYRLESLGIPVIGWPGEPRHEPAPGQHSGTDLDAALSPYARRRVRGGVR
jgi:uncharacterized protein (DUF58 family)